MPKSTINPAKFLHSFQLLSFHCQYTVNDYTCIYEDALYKTFLHVADLYRHMILFLLYLSNIYLMHKKATVEKFIEQY